MNQSDEEREKLLLIGGTSSLSQAITKNALNNHYEVYSTYRTYSKIFSNSEIIWNYLDISKVEEIDKFLITLNDKKFTRIIYVIGQTSLGMQKEISCDELSKYLKIQLTNALYLIQHIVKCLDDKKKSNFIFLSSRAGLYGSFDWPYGVVKAGIQNMVTSLSNKSNFNTSFFSIAPGLIRGSTMELNMSQENKKSHYQRAINTGEELLNIEELASIIWKIGGKESAALNGSVIEVGPKY